VVGSPPDSSFSQISKFRAFYSRSWRRMRKVRAGHHTPGTRQFITGRLDISTYACGCLLLTPFYPANFMLALVLLLTGPIGGIQSFQLIRT
jgi:hypothetical protein